MSNNEYKYGYKIGCYTATINISCRCFDLIFNKDFKDKRKRIKWLSNIEAEELMEITIECVAILKKSYTQDMQLSINKKKEDILKLLR